METSRKFRLFYDGECPFCKVEIDMVKRAKLATEVDFEDIAAEHFDAASYGLTQDDFMREIRAQLPSGELIQGMDVFRHMYRILGYGWAVKLTELPLIRQIFNLGYKGFARIRVPLGNMVSGGCRADSSAESCELPRKSE